MWQTKVFRFGRGSGNTQAAARRAYLIWRQRHEGRYQIETIFVNNAYGVLYRPLRVIDLD